MKEEIKIGPNLFFVPANEVPKYLKIVKKHELGNLVAFWTSLKEAAPADVIRWAEECRSLGLYFFTLYGTQHNLLTAELVAKIKKVAGNYYLGDSLGEMSLSIYGGSSQYIPHGARDMEEAKWQYVNAIKKKVDTAKALGISRVMDTEGIPAGHKHGYEAGADMVLAEHAGNIVLTMSSARGMSRAYGKPEWGSWVNMEFYGGGVGGPEDDSYSESHYRRFMLDLNLAYIYGANLICIQDSLFNIRILNSIDPSYPTYDFESAQCAGFRKVAQQFYRFVQRHPRAEGGPVVKLGFVHGNLDSFPDLCSFWNQASRAWGEYDRPAWEPSGAEKGWECLDQVIPEDPHPLRRHSSTPYGQIDIVPSEAPLDVLKQYSALVFLGWNTMTIELYEKLCEYCEDGGHLFMSLGHLSTHVNRQDDLKLLRNGDFNSLFGLTVKGKGELARQVKFTEQSSLINYRFPVGLTLPFTSFLAERAESERALLADIKLNSARVLASEPNSGNPILIENSIGKGKAFLLTVWGYPGDFLTSSKASGQRTLKFFVRNVLETIVRGEMGEIHITDGKRINYAVYEKKESGKHLRTIYLVNTDWTTANNCRSVKLHLGKSAFTIGVKEGAIRKISFLEHLALGLLNGEANIEALECSGDEYEAVLSGRGALEVEGFLLEGRHPDEITLEGKKINYEYDKSREKFTFKCNLQGKGILTVMLKEN
jgi:hypothetical protein